MTVALANYSVQLLDVWDVSAVRVSFSIKLTTQ